MSSSTDAVFATALGDAEVAAKPRVGRQQVLLVEAPHLLREGNATRSGHVPREEAVQVVDVTNQELPGIGVVRGVDGLRKVDHHGPIPGDEHVELREVAVHDAGAEHLHRRANEAVVHRASAHGIERKIAEPRGGVSARRR